MKKEVNAFFDKSILADRYYLLTDTMWYHLKALEKMNESPEGFPKSFYLSNKIEA